MKTVYKYELDINVDLAYQELVINLPIGVAVLNIGVQDSNPCLWALVDKLRDVAPVTFVIVYTGRESQSLNADNYLGTFTLFQGRMVYHVFRK